MTPSGNFPHSHAQSGPIFPNGKGYSLMNRTQLIGQGLSE
jgi:hypothetical protein